MLKFLQKLRRNPKEPEKVLYCEGREVRPMQEYYFGAFMEHEKKEYNQFREMLTEKNICLYCSNGAFDNFLNRIALAGRMQSFTKAMLNYVKENPSEVYIMRENGEEINIAEMKKSE